MQIDNKFTAFWMDTSTAPWTPLTGLSATITIQEVDAPYTVVVNAEPMIEMWGWNYIYIFTGMSLSKEYAYSMDPWATAFIQSWVTNNTLYQWIQENRWWWGGGFSINYQAINSHTSSKVNELKEVIDKKIKEIPQVSLENTEKKLNEIVSQNDIAKTEIINTIKSSENEICSDVIRKTKEIKEDNIKTRNLVRQKSEKVVKYAEKQLDRQEKLEKEIEDTENEIKEEFERIESEEKEISDLFDQYDKDEEEIKAEFDKLESNN